MGAGFSAMKKVIPLGMELTYGDDSVMTEAPKEPEVDYSNVEPLVLWEPSDEERETLGESCAVNISVELFLCKWLRPHQREGVRFMAECLTGQRDFDGAGSILADDMGLGKTLQVVWFRHFLLTVDGVLI